MRKYLILSCLLSFHISSMAQSIEYDKKLGKEYSTHVEAEMGITKHNESVELVKTIGTKLENNIENKKFDYKFEVVDMAMPNAFALPGGYVYVSRGILPLFNSEDDLAGVMGHEIGHCEHRHSVKQMRRQIIPALLKLPGNIVGLTVDEHLGQMINTPLNTGSSLFLAQYSRKHEKQADKYGLALMAESGFAPIHFPDVLARLSNVVEEFTGQEETFSYFDSHPYTPKRVKYLDKEIEKHQFSSKEIQEQERNEFLQKLDGLCFGPNPINGVFNENILYHPNLNLYMKFPKGWDTDNQPGVFGAMDTINNESMIVVGVLPELKDPENSGQEFIKKIRKKFNQDPEMSRSFEVNGIKGFVVSYKDKSGNKEMGIHSLWFNINGKSCQFIGLAPYTENEKLKATAKSIRTLTTDEINSIDVMKIRLVKANEDETLSDLNERTGNVINIDVTATINDIKKDTKLHDGQLVKVVKKEKYKK